MTRSTPHTICFSLALAVTFGLLSTTAEARTWTNKEGRKIEAEYVGAEDGQVQLRHAATGKIHTIPVESLSAQDQRLIGGDLFSRKLRENPNDADLYFQRGMARTNRDESDAAVNDFNYAIELNPQHAEAYDGRGMARSQAGNSVKAQKDFDRAIEIDPQLASAYRHRADNYKALSKTPEGKTMVDTRAETYRKSYQAARQQQLRDKGWQPLNSTSGPITRGYGPIAMLAKADYEMAHRIEAGYRVGYGRGGVGYGGGIGIGGGKGYGVGVGVGKGPGYPGSGKVMADAPLAVYPAKVVQGETITIVANASELAKGMPQRIGANGKPIKSAYGKSGKMDVANVEFYRDVNGNGELDESEDLLLGSDVDGSDGYSLEVSTAKFPPGPQNFFAKPEGSQGSGLSPQDLTTIAESLEQAASAEKQIAEQSSAASDGSGLTSEQAESLQKQNADDVAEVAQDAYKQLQTALPEVAELVSDAGKPVRAVGNLMKAAAGKPGEESKEKASSASDKASEAAKQLAEAAAKLRETAESGEMPVASGSPLACQCAVLPKKDQVASASPKPGPGKPGPGKPAEGSPGPGKDGPGDDKGYGGDDDDTIVVNDDDDGDTTIVIDDDDDGDRIVIDDDDDVVIDAVDRALGYVDDGDYDRAIVEYDRLVVDEPDNVVLRSGRAGAYLNRGGYDLAVRDYDRLLVNPTVTVDQKVDFYYNRGCAHLAAGRLADAIADFTASIELKETGALAYMAYNNRGISFAKQGDFEEALANFNRAVEINPGDVLAYRNRALAYKKLGKTAEAEKDMARVNDLSSL